MSYILEALRKSEQQRQRGALPNLRTAPMILAAPRRRSRIYYAGFAAVLLLGAGIMIGWLRPWQPEPPVLETNPVAANGVPIARQDVPAPALATPETAAATVQPDSDLGAMRMNATSPGKDSGGQASTPGIPASELSRKESPRRDAAMPEKRASEAVAAERPMEIEELPLQIRQEIPVMAVQLHAYSSIPGDRLVSINFVRLREGGTLAPGLTLEQIKPDGMIFSYKGYRFRRGIR